MAPVDDHALQRGLARAALRSERARSRILAALFAAMALAGLVLWDVQDPLSTALGTAAVKQRAVAAASVALCFELAMVWFFDRRIADGRLPPRSVVVATLLAEVALTGGMVMMAAAFVHPIDAFVIPPGYVLFVLVVLSPLRMDEQLCVLTGVAGAATWLVVTGLLLPAARASSGATLLSATWLPHIGRAAVIAVSGVLAAFVTRQLSNRHRLNLRLREERQRIVDVFGQHVSPQVVDKVLAQEAELPPETRHVCMLFLDIRGFTTFSESRSPAEVVDYLNALFEPLVDCVAAHEGIINKFLGDGFMAVFGAPVSDGADCAHAVRASLAMLEAVDRLVAAGIVPPTKVGIGLHAGQAMTGTVGSRRRKEYTVIGDTVNLAARIEALNKHFDSTLLVSQEVWSAVEAELGELVEVERLPATQVKGRDEAVELYRLERRAA